MRCVQTAPWVSRSLRAALALSLVLVTSCREPRPDTAPPALAVGSAPVPAPSEGRSPPSASSVAAAPELLSAPREVTLPQVPATQLSSNSPPPSSTSSEPQIDPADEAQLEQRSIAGLSSAELTRLIVAAERATLHGPEIQYTLHRSDGDGSKGFHSARYWHDILASCQRQTAARVDCDYRGCVPCFEEHFEIELRRTARRWKVVKFSVDWNDRHHGCGICY
ncbi:MAG TPA: hypothetical protein VHM70_18920 [Polyangiaceae bacterium]|nr:hypothetical protein [Polyangiaceae bacterium]